MAPAIETLTPRHRPHHPAQRDRTNGQSAPTFSILSFLYLELLIIIIIVVVVVLCLCVCHCAFARPLTNSKLIGIGATCFHFFISLVSSRGKLIWTGYTTVSDNCVPRIVTTDDVFPEWKFPNTHICHCPFKCPRPCVFIVSYLFYIWEEYKKGKKNRFTV